MYGFREKNQKIEKLKTKKTKKLYIFKGSEIFWQKFKEYDFFFQKHTTKIIHICF